MIEMQIEIDDKRVQEMLKKMHPAIQQALLRFLTKSGIIVKSSAKAYAPVDTSNLRGGISYRLEGIRQVIIGPNVDYGIYVEKGTKPHFPPVKALSEWAGRVLGDASLGFVIARGISRKGTKKQPYMQPALQDNLGNIRGIFFREINLAIQRI